MLSGSHLEAQESKTIPVSLEETLAVFEENEYRLVTAMHQELAKRKIRKNQK